MRSNNSPPTTPEQHIETLLAEREEYIRQQEALRNTRTGTELKLLLSMIDERSAEDPFVHQIRDTHVEDGGLPSFNTLYDEWKAKGYEIERIRTH